MGIAVTATGLALASGRSRERVGSSGETIDVPRRRGHVVKTAYEWSGHRSPPFSGGLGRWITSHDDATYPRNSNLAGRIVGRSFCTFETFPSVRFRYGRCGTELRANLRRWIDAARQGADVVITDRGSPVARIVAVDSTEVIDRLTAQGIIGRPTRPTRPVAGDRPPPKPRRPVADIVSEQRR